MAKGAANEQSMGGLHSMLARVFQKVLNKYEAQLDALDNIDRDDVAEDMLAVIAEIGEPNPAMLSAIAKFLKDNDIGMDSEEVDELNATQRRLAERREARKRAGMANLAVVPHVGEQ